MKKLSHVHIKLLFFIWVLLGSSQLLAQTDPQCFENDAILHDNRCYYCANGTEKVSIHLTIDDKSYSILPFKCAGIPRLGPKCSDLHTHHYNRKTHICSYCPPGYIFDFHRTKCYRH